MKSKYKYKDSVYFTEFEIRKALFEKEGIAIGKTPANNIDSFWSQFGVAYSENDEPVDVHKTFKLADVKQAFLNWRNNQATLVSSLGFKADSNERANMDVSGLLVVYEDKQKESITFRDADNQFHSLTFSQLKTLQKEIIENGAFAYMQKWELDAQVESATTKEELDAIEVKFKGKNFLEGVLDAE